MAGAGGIRVGATYVEICGNDAPLRRTLGLSKEALRGFASSANTELAGIGSDAGGGMKWMQRIARGAGVGIAVHELGAIMSAAAAALKGEWEKVGEAIGSVPILGGAAISLANGFDDLVLGIRAGMKRMHEEALAELKYSQNVLSAANKELALKMQIAMVGADPFNRRLMEINEKARKDTQAEYQRARDAGQSATHPAVKGVIDRIEELRQKEKAAAYHERDKAEGQKRLDLFVANQKKISDEAQKGREAERKAEDAADDWALESVIGFLERRNDLYEEGQALREKVDPEARAKAEIERAKELFEEGVIGADTLNRAMRAALEGAVSSMPDVLERTIGVRGTFNAMEVAGLGTGGVADRMARGIDQIEKNTQKIAELAKRWGVTFA